jgi:23S rRNA (cytidine1920-2'-O)/16S rRNA (cytidine1409-2'-O)-methyltransferase
VAARTRLDSELVRHGLVTSRTAAQRAIESGSVIVGGLPAARAATLVSPETPISIRSAGPRFVSRGGDKLDGALERIEVAVEGRRWLDAGASTGGFTDCLLRRGAAAVAAVDVGYGQLDWGLRNDERVRVIERTNVRALDAATLPWEPDAAVADLSFISLTLVLPALAAVVPGHDADLVVMVKPQFEAGRGAIERGGVVRDPAVWRTALERVARAAATEGLAVSAAVPSHLPGPAGNREFFLHLRRAAAGDDGAIERAIQEVS